jgi:hypothetical protein
MGVKFHESIATLADVAIRNNLPLDLQTVIVRDGAGRLIYAREDVRGPARAEKALRDALGGYIGTVAIVTGSAAKRLLSDPALAEIELKVGDTKFLVRFADRRIVGMDWLRSPVQPVAGPKRLIFGSLKGGVGRSTALAVLAADLARRGRKVLAIDLDLEAPGVGFMLLPGDQDLAQDRRPQFGVVDYLLENALNGVSDEELYDFVGVSPFLEGSIDVIPAVGRTTDERPETMIAKLSRALVEDRSGDQIISVTDQVRSMVSRFTERGIYDAILIDARAGMAEITAAPLIGLGGEILFFGTNQTQTFRGYAYVLSHLVSVSDFSQSAQAGDWRQRVSFVQSRAPSAASKRAEFRERLYELCASRLYDEERLDPDGQIVPAEFAPGPDEVGVGVPHDSVHIQFNPEYEAFDPIGDRTQLDPEVYSGPFGVFLDRGWQLLGLSREAER